MAEEGGGEGEVRALSIGRVGGGESLSQVCKISNDLYGGRQELPVLRQTGKLLSQAKVHQASIPGVETEGTTIMRLHIHIHTYRRSSDIKYQFLEPGNEAR